MPLNQEGSWVVKKLGLGMRLKKWRVKRLRREQTRVARKEIRKRMVVRW